MVSSRIPLIAFGMAVLALSACGSDDNSSKSTTSTTSAATGTSSLVTTTTTVGGVTTQTTAITPVTVGSQTTVAGATTTTAAGSTSGATTTTVKGRTVTSPSDNVRLGDKGDGVKQIQTALKAQGYKVSVDGDFGNQTDAAVKQFQKKNNLKVDGIVGKVTWAKLSAGKSTSSTTAGATTTTTK